MRTILVGPGRKLLKHRLASAAAKDRPKIFAQLVEVLITQHLSVLIDHAVAMEETKSRRQAAVVDKLDDRIQLVQTDFPRACR